MRFKSRESTGHLEGLRAALKIDKDRLDEAVIRQPVLFDEVAEQYTLAVSRRDEAKSELDDLYSKLDIRIRTQAKEKLTNPEVDARIGQTSEYKKQERKYAELATEAAQWATLRESFMQRGYMLRELCGLFASGYWTNSSIRGASGEAAVRAVHRGLKPSMRR